MTSMTDHRIADSLSILNSTMKEILEEIKEINESLDAIANNMIQDQEEEQLHEPKE
jgi:hypothetical protein